MPPKFQLLAVMAFGIAMMFIENQIQKLEESRTKLGELRLTENKMFHVGHVCSLCTAQVARIN